MHMALNANPERASVWSYSTSSSFSHVLAELLGSPRFPLCETLWSPRVRSFQAHLCLSSFLLSVFSHSLPLQIHGLHEEHSSWPVTQSLLTENSVFSKKVCFLCPKIALLEILLLSFFFFFWCTPCWPWAFCLCLSNTAVKSCATVPSSTSGGQESTWRSRMAAIFC